MSRAAPLVEAKRWRRNSLVNLTLTDIFIVVVFVLLLFTFRADEEGRKEISLAQAQLAAAEAERLRLLSLLNAAETTISDLKKKVQDLELLVARLLEQTKRETLEPNPQRALRELRGENEELKRQAAQAKAEAESREALLRSLQAALAEKERLLAQQGRGSGYPRCLVTSGFLLEIRLLASGNIHARPAWDDGAERFAREVPGVSDLIAVGETSLDNFRRQASRIAAWGEQQATPCRFHVKTVRETSQLDLYLQQMKAIDRYFYPRR